MNVRKLILGIAVSVLPFATLTVGGTTIAGASSVGSGTVSCYIYGTVTFRTPLSYNEPRTCDAAKITVNPSESSCSSGISITKGSGRFVVSDPDESPCFMHGGGWGSALSLSLHYSHLKGSVLKGFISGVQTGSASSIDGGGTVKGSYASSDATFNDSFMNDMACNTGITSTSINFYLTNF